MIRATTGILSQKSNSLFVLDNISNTSLVAAWSNRKLLTAYTGNANQIRRSNDNVTANIGFSGIDYDTTTLASHVGANSGFINTWYDQSGNSRNLTQSTNGNQPRIRNSGTNDVINSKITCYYDGVNSNLFTTNIISGLINNNNLSMVLVFQKLNSSYSTIINQGKDAAYFHFGLVSYNTDNNLRFRNTNNDFRYGSNTNTTSDKQIISIINTGTTSECFRNGTSIGTTPNGVVANGVVAGNELAIGRRANDASEFLNGNISEIIIFTRNLSTGERQIIERNMGTYYNITVA